jgi:hypothetical protein
MWAVGLCCGDAEGPFSVASVIRIDYAGGRSGRLWIYIKGNNGGEDCILTDIGVNILRRLAVGLILQSRGSEQPSVGRGQSVKVSTYYIASGE